jgi:hypothetical protein
MKSTFIQTRDEDLSFGVEKRSDSSTLDFLTPFGRSFFDCSMA